MTAGRWIPKIPIGLRIPLGIVFRAAKGGYLIKKHSTKGCRFSAGCRDTPLTMESVT